MGCGGYVEQFLAVTYILRHTFASHFMMNGGDVLSLQKLLGHSDLKMTIRYAHLSPDHLAQAIELNPISRLEARWSLDQK